MKTVYLFFFDGYISVAPTIIGLAETLSDIYDKVVVFVKDTPYGRYKFNNPKINIVYGNDFFRKNKNLSKVKNYIFAVLKYFVLHGFPKHKDVFIAIDDKIMPFVSILSKIFFADLFYLSLELSVTNLSLINKFLFNAVKVILIQDRLRLNALFSLYGIIPKRFKGKIFFIPNSPMISDFKISEEKNLIEQFSAFPKDKIICAQIGMLNSNVYSYELANVFNNIDNAVLILHDRLTINFEDSYVRSIMEVNSNNLYFSKKVYAFDDLYLVYNPIDIGIALYRYVDQNFGLIGKASGKMAFYFMYKKPVIVNFLKGYSEIIDKYNCGIVIHDINNPEEWRNAILKIKSNYAYYSQNAYECYLKEFDFRAKSVDFLNYIKGK